MDPKGGVALVTGSADRLGRAIAIGLARAGARIAVHHHSSSKLARSTADEIRSLGVEVDVFRADLTDVDQIATLFDSIDARFGRLDILINNAAIFERSDVGDIRPEDWDRVLDLNLRAAFFCSQHAVRLMRAGDQPARIINIADVAALEPWPGYVHYCVSKAGLVMLTRALARALAPDVLVNAVAPGTVLPPQGISEAARKKLSGMTALGRLGTPEDVVRAVRFLVESNYVTGETIVVDGGKLLKN